MKERNVHVLYDFVKKNDFKRILDLGTGIGLSAATIALALKNNESNDFEIHTVEQNEKCYKIAQKIMPEELKMNIQFHHIKATIWMNPDIPFQSFSIYEYLPEGEYDLIINDGSGPFLMSERDVRKKIKEISLSERVE